METRTRSQLRFARYAWFFLGYLLFVVLYGAWVRITHSGAGCGRHWPLCDGEVVPLAPTAERLVEYTHRVTSGLSGLLGIVLVVWAWRAFPRWHRAVRGALVVFVFLLVEGALGAGLVLRGLVADDASLARAVVISFHLANTLILVGAAGLTAWWAGGGQGLGRDGSPRVRFLVAAGVAGLVVTSMTGAVTALGDTLFPIGSGTPPEAHFLVRLRIVHPLVAVAVAFLLFAVAARVRATAARPLVRRAALVASGLVALQLAAGLLDVLLAAPPWLQLVHLLLAQAVWLAVLIMGVEATAAPQEAPGGVPAGTPVAAH